MATQKEELPPELKALLDKLVALFYLRIETQPFSSEYYNKWFSTVDVCRHGDVDLSLAEARKQLTKLEKLGYVTAKRENNWIKWAAVTIPGYRQHRFDDYFEPDSKTNTT